MILSFINIRKVPREMLKTSGFALGFQHFPRDLMNVSEWKIMFDPYNIHFRNLFHEITCPKLVRCQYMHQRKTGTFLRQRTFFSLGLMARQDYFTHFDPS